MAMSLDAMIVVSVVVFGAGSGPDVVRWSAIRVSREVVGDEMVMMFLEEFLGGIYMSAL